MEQIKLDDICPNCESHNVEGDEPDYGNHTIQLPFTCNDCETTWNAQYGWYENTDIETIEDQERIMNSKPTYTLPPEAVYKGEEGFKRILAGLPGNGGKN